MQQTTSVVHSSIGDLPWNVVVSSGRWIHDLHSISAQPYVVKLPTYRYMRLVMLSHVIYYGNRRR